MSGAGWSLKKGEIKNKHINLNQILEKVLVSKSTTCYKYFLLKFILDNLKNTKKEFEFEEIYLYILKDFYDYYSLYKEKMNINTKKSNLYLLLERKNLKEINKKDLNFLKQYVFGALYNDTEGVLFGFSKDKEIIYLNNIEDIIDKNFSEKLYNKIKISLGLENILNYEYKIENIVEEKIIMEEKAIYYQQKFALEIDYILKNISTTFENNTSFFELLKNISKQELADILGIGVPKLTAQLQYMACMNLYDGVNETNFAKKISKMNYNSDYVEPLLYYYLVKNSSLGHYIYSELINEVIYKLFNNSFENEVTLTKILDSMSILNKDKLNKKDWDTMIKQALNCLLNPETGFGKMGILEEVNSDKKGAAFELHSYWVEPLVGAYIIYDLWREGQTTMEISSIIHDKYNIGRIFLMDQDAIMETLEEIKALGLIDINLTAGLNQITKSSRYTREDILDMMIKQS